MSFSCSSTLAGKQLVNMQNEDVINFFKGFKKPEDEDKKEQYLRDKYPGLFPPKKFTPEK